jgi:dienelactone hydrolase
MARSNGWSYIHPDFRGPNHTKDACLSQKVVSDIDDAIQYAIDTGSVDTGNMYVVGVSGGGHAALGAYLRSRHRLKAVLAWVPVSDLITYFHQSRSRNTEYAKDILQCTSDGITLDENEVRRRSPIFWDFPATPRSRLELYTGINDGYTGNVPISHSVLFFNRVAEQYGYPESRVDAADMVKLLTRGIERGSGEPRKVVGRYGVLFSKSTPVASLTIFDGGHDWSAKDSFDRIKEMAEPTSTSRSGALTRPGPLESLGHRFTRIGDD